MGVNIIAQDHETTPRTRSTNPNNVATTHQSPTNHKLERKRKRNCEAGKVEEKGKKMREKENGRHEKLSLTM